MRQYIGSRENRLVQVAVASLFDREPAYNPLVFHGRTGTGKTLLAEGLAQQWAALHDRRPVQTICGADFARAYANALDTQSLADFRCRFRHVGFLAIDDIQEMQRKPAAQHELVRTLDVLFNSGAVVVVTSNSSPVENQAFIAPLRSRLHAGLTVPLTTPGPEARQLLLQRFATLHEVSLAPDALLVLAERLNAQQSTVPELNRVILQLRQAAPAPRTELEISFVRRFLSKYVQSGSLDLSAITQHVSRFFSIPVRDLRGPLRKQHIVRARGVAMYLAWHLTDKSLETIGKYFGKRDHTTVLHACRKTETLRDSDPSIDRAVTQLTQQLESL